MQQFDFNSNIFGDKINIPATAKIVFVSDMFVDDYVGGAELTTQALIDSSPFEIFKLHSKDVTMELLREGQQCFWIFGNFAAINANLLPTIIGNMKYSVVEYDYKYCKVRSPEKHFETLGVPCDCPNQINGKMVSAFFYGAMGLWWMSQAQKEKYFTSFPFLSEKSNIVLSSIFDKKTLGFLRLLRGQNTDAERKGWIVLGSSSWIKGADDAQKWCKDNEKDFEVVWNLPYDQVLQKLALAEGFVYLPKGGDTCPRMVIEAKLLGCKLHINDNVQHASEEWFNTDDLKSIEEYLFTAPGLFWNGIKKMMEYRPTISGYTTTFNAVKQEYPFEQCIKSMLEFCDEVCVVDGGSTDGTLEKLRKLEENDSRIKVEIRTHDNHPHFAMLDGMQKAHAREMCSKEFVWQQDSDEIVHNNDAIRILELCRSIPKDIDVIALPVIEGWGSWDKIRLDVTPWKWRLTRNRRNQNGTPKITHGVPKDLRVCDVDGNLLYAKQGTDGCDLIDAATFERTPFVNFYPPEIENIRRAAMLGDELARQNYEQWFNKVVSDLPCIFHYSWIDISRKIRLYRDFWQNHWAALWNQDTSDTAKNNMFFDVPWSEVTDEMIETRAIELNKIGGWIWHKKWRGELTPWITCSRTPPNI